MLVKALSDWMKEREAVKKRIGKLSPRDRLEYVSACFECTNVIGRSSWGWLQWLSNPAIMSGFDEATLGDFFRKLKEFATSYIEFDIEATKKGVKPELLEERKREPYA